MLKISIKNQHGTAEYSTEKELEHISEYVEILEGLLLMVGFQPDTIKDYLRRD